MAKSVLVQYRKILKNLIKKQNQGFKEILRYPATLSLVVMVLALSLIMPTWLYLVKKNTEQPLVQIRQNAQITMFLKLDISDEKGAVLAKNLKQESEIVATDFVPKSVALEMFKQESGLAGQIEALTDDNPLPATIFIKAADISSVAKVQELMQRLAKLPEADLVTMDLFWANKLEAIFDVGQRMFWILLILFGLSFALTVFFTIKTVIQEHFEEISLTLMLGATHSYIKARYIQLGFWLGLASAIICIILTNLAIMLVRSPVSEFAAEFSVQPAIGFLSFSETLVLLVFGISVAILVSWFTCTNYLQRTENCLHS